MGRLLIFLLPFLLLAACVKQNNNNPVPVLEFRDFENPHKTATGSDTAVMVIGYEDGDGDLFVDRSTQAPNFFFTTLYQEPGSSTFTVTIDPITNDTLRFSTKIYQPDNGYYKGKSIKGEIYVPLKEFRPNNKVKVVKFFGYMADTKGHRSNTFVSPVYTLTF
jgi:hypothetical protein